MYCTALLFFNLIRLVKFSTNMTEINVEEIPILIAKSRQNIIRTDIKFKYPLLLMLAHKVKIV